ncbi:MAG: hypothetical protein C5B45_05500 [Chlamydiae bacterium]|nr:MAG: hypothetical protein C5B45_05500 [Chlamydiota bacterium]
MNSRFYIEFYAKKNQQIYLNKKKTISRSWDIPRIDIKEEICLEWIILGALYDKKAYSSWK